MSVLDSPYFLFTNREGSDYVDTNLFHYKNLTKEEMNDLLAEYSKTKSRAIRDEIILHSTKLVSKIVNDYNKEDRDDLLQIGMIGLIKAVDSFSFDKNVPWGSYSAFCIKNEIRMHFRTKNYEKRSKFTECSIYAEVDTKKEDSVTVLDMLYDKNVDIFEEVALNIEIENLNNIMKGILKEKEYRVMELRYGLNDNNIHTQKETGDIMGIARSQVSRYEKSSIQKIKNELIGGKIIL